MRPYTVVLVEDGAETQLRAGDCAAFQKASGHGHHLIIRVPEPATFLKPGARQPEDVASCSDVDLMSDHKSGVFAHKDGGPYPA